MGVPEANEEFHKHNGGGVALGSLKQSPMEGVRWAEGGRPIEK